MKTFRGGTDDETFNPEEGGGRCKTDNTICFAFGTATTDTLCRTMDTGQCRCVRYNSLHIAVESVPDSNCKN